MTSVCTEKKTLLRAVELAMLKEFMVEELTKLLEAKDEEISHHDEEIARRDKEITRLKNGWTACSWDVKNTTRDMGLLQEKRDITEGELTILKNSEKDWIGRALKLKFIFDEIKKIGALPNDHAEWVEPMVEDIKFPEVSIGIMDVFIPTAQTDNTDYVDEDEGEWEEEWEDEDEEVRNFTQCSTCGECREEGQELFCDCGWRGLTHVHVVYRNGARETMINIINDNPLAILEKSVKTIQKAWKNYQRVPSPQRQLRLALRRVLAVSETLDSAPTRCRLMSQMKWVQLHPWRSNQEYCATKIQRVWRGYSVRK